MKKETVITCEYSELDELISKRFEIDYELMAQNEVGSSQYAAVWEYDISLWEDYDSKTAVETYHEALSEVEDYDGFYDFETYVHILCYEGALEPGKYMIGVSW